MRYHELIGETIVADVPANKWDGNDVSLHANPSAAEFRGLIGAAKPIAGEVRFFLFTDTDLLLIWDAEQSTHGTMLTWLMANHTALVDQPVSGRFIGGLIKSAGRWAGPSATRADHPGWALYFNDYGGGPEHDHAALAASAHFTRMVDGAPWRVTLSFASPPNRLIFRGRQPVSA